MNKWFYSTLVAVFLAFVFLINTLLCFNQVFFQLIYPRFAQLDKFGWSWANQTPRAVTLVRLLNQDQQFDNFSLAKYQILMSEDELSHMNDVEELLIKTKVLTAFLFGIITAILVKLIRAKKITCQFIRKMIKQTLIIYVEICTIVSIVIIRTWSAFFITFHRLFFPDGSWSFSESSTLIRLFPEIFWQKIFALIILLPVVELIILYIVTTLSLKFLQNGKITK